MRAASRVVVVTPGMKEMIEKRYADLVANKLRVVMNGYDPDDFDAEIPVPESDRIEIVYVGTMSYHVTPPTTLLQALELLLERNPDIRRRLRIRILGGVDLDSSQRIREWLDHHHGADMVAIEEFVDHRSATRAMQRAHALLLIIAEGAHWILTSKVFEYLASRTPIIAVVPDGDCRDLLRECGGAVLIRPGRPGDLAATMEAAVDAGRVRPDSPRRIDAMKQYSHPEMAARMALVLEEIAT